jgi:hypothetical protein
VYLSTSATGVMAVTTNGELFSWGDLSRPCPVKLDCVGENLSVIGNGFSIIYRPFNTSIW